MARLPLKVILYVILGDAEQREKCKKQTPFSPLKRIGILFSKIKEKNNCMEYFFLFPLIFPSPLVFGGSKWSTWAHCAAHPTFRMHDLCIIESPYMSHKE